MYINFPQFNTEKLFLRFHGLFEYVTNQFSKNLEQIKKDLAKLVLKNRLNFRKISDLKQLNKVLFSAMFTEKNLDHIKKCYSNQSISEIFQEFNPKVQSLLKKNNEIQLFLNEFLFKSYQMFRYLEKMEKLDELITQQAFELKEEAKRSCKTNPKCPELVFPTNNLLVFDTLTTSEYISCISPFLRLLIVLQNRILWIIGMILDIKDKHDTFSWYFKNDRLDAKLKQFPIAIQNICVKYWKKHAKMIRNYRDIDEHRYNILNNYGLDHHLDFHVILPDSAEKGVEITYKKNLKALPLFTQEFTSFHEFIDELLKSMKIAEKQFNIGKSFTNEPIYPSNYEDGTCVSMFQTGNEVICLYNKGGGEITMNKHKFPYNELRYEIRSR